MADGPKGLGGILSAFQVPDACPEGLGEHLIAVRVDKGGRVPKDCIGILREANGLRDWLKEGEKASTPKSGSLWWVYSGRKDPDGKEHCYHLSFAPDAATPEAGVRLTIHPVMPWSGEEWFFNQLAEWVLSTPGPALALEDLAKELRDKKHLRQYPCILQPCMQREEKDRLQIDFSSLLGARFGLRCIALERIDLYGDEKLHVNCAKELAAQCAALSSAETGAEFVVPAPEVELSPQEALAADLAFDERCGRRLASELPRLAWLLDERVSTSDPADPAIRQRLELYYRLDHLAATTDRLPTLTPWLTEALPPKRRRLLVAESRQAIQWLNEAWGLLAVPGVEIDQSLERVINGLELAIARRKSIHGWEEAS